MSSTQTTATCQILRRYLACQTLRLRMKVHQSVSCTEDLCADMAGVGLTCISFPQVVSSRLFIDGQTTKLQHMAALDVAAIAAGALLHHLKLLLQSFLQ